MFNWLFARHHGGTFVLRIEDTDRARFNPDAVEDLLVSLRWLGIDWDEGPEVGGEHGPYVQSERREIYRKYADQLIEQGHAYRCYCAPERLDAMRKEQQAHGRSGYDRQCRELTDEERARHEKEGAPWVVRCRMPLDGATTFTDAIRGQITYPNAQQDDFVIMKSDGFPTYHLANVVDDHLMKITHVMRGEEWIPSTPKHVFLYESLGWTPPVFAHLPVILAPGGGKLSKRHGAAAVSEYRKMGYLPEAMVNFLALLGSSVSTDNEVVTIEQLLREFELEKVNKTGAQFDRDKLDWMNGAYIRQLAVDELVSRVRPLLEDAGLVDDTTSPEKLRCVVALLQGRMKHLTEVVDSARYFFTDDIDYEEKAVRKFVAKPGIRENLRKLGERFAAIGDEEFTSVALEEVVQQFLAESEQSLKKVVHPLRVAVTGRSASPGIFDTLSAIGKERVLRRIDYAIEHLVSA